MNLNVINPLLDKRWNHLVDRHPSASIFHTQSWLEALHRTYGFEPVVVTHLRSEEPLTDGIVFCRVSSWITGKRLVSLPFSDHCDPLLAASEALTDLTEYARVVGDQFKCGYLELRPLLPMSSDVPGLEKSSSYCVHVLDLSPKLQELFTALHKDSIQRKVRRAEREGLTYETGRSAVMVDEFYRLLVRTRKRHCTLPQPRVWFRNLVECFGEKGQISVARKEGVAIAALLSLRHRSTVVYKYGCSDERRHNLGGMPWLFWKLIEQSKASGAEAIDLGRSNWNQEGLTTFKDRLGAARRPLQYYRYSLRTNAVKFEHRSLAGIGPLLAVLPDAVLSATGNLLYRHWG